MPIDLVQQAPGRYAVFVDRDKAGSLSLETDSYTLSIPKRLEKRVRPAIRRIIPYNLQENFAPSVRMAAGFAPKKKEAGPTEDKDVAAPSASRPASSTCLRTFVIEPATADKIRSLCKDVFFMEGKKKVGKEFFGRLHIVPSPGGPTVLKYDEKKVVTGDKDGIDGFDDSITYHTHPYPTYLHYDAKYAWPSKTDYTSILDTLTHGRAVAHIVVTMEGVYIVSLGDHFCDHPDELRSIVSAKGNDYKRLLFKYDREYPYMKKGKRTVISNPDEFIRHANAQTINGKQVLINQFIPWSAPSLTFSIRSATTPSGCKLK